MNGTNEGKQAEGGGVNYYFFFFRRGGGAENYYYVEVDLLSGLVAGTAAVDELSGTKGPRTGIYWQEQSL